MHIHKYNTYFWYPYRFGGCVDGSIYCLRDGSYQDVRTKGILRNRKDIFCKLLRNDRAKDIEAQIFSFIFFHCQNIFIPDRKMNTFDLKVTLLQMI